MLKELDETDFLILERYWLNYRNYRGQLSKPMQDSVRQANLKRIVEGIETTYNAAPEDYQTLIRYCYWNEDGEGRTWNEVGKLLHLTKPRLNIMKTALLETTARNINYIY